MTNGEAMKIDGFYPGVTDDYMKGFGDGVEECQARYQEVDPQDKPLITVVFDCEMETATPFKPRLVSWSTLDDERLTSGSHDLYIKPMNIAHPLDQLYEEYKAIAYGDIGEMSYVHLWGLIDKIGALLGKIDS